MFFFGVTCGWYQSMFDGYVCAKYTLKRDRFYGLSESSRVGYLTRDAVDGCIYGFSGALSECSPARTFT